MVAFRLVERSDGEAPSFAADLSRLATLGLPSEAQVIVEAYVRTSSMRFDFGTISAVTQPTNTVLAEIDRADAAVSFRVKVVDTSERRGRLLAFGDQIRPREEHDQHEPYPILPLDERDLGEKLWTIEVGADSSPRLVINRRVPRLGEQVRQDPLVQGLVFPGAVRAVLQYLLREDINTEQEWVADWTEFVESLLGQPLESPAEDVDDLIDRILDSLADRECWVQRMIANTVEPEVLDE